MSATETISRFLLSRYREKSDISSSPAGISAGDPKMRRSRFSSGESESSAASDEKIEWEMRPGGMLVQKRAAKSDIPVPDLRLRVAYGTFRYEISIKSQATFGNLSFLLLLRVCNGFFFFSRLLLCAEKIGF